MLAAERHRFLDDYLRIRRAEGRGSDDPAYYLALPYEDRSGKFEAQWAMRAKSYRRLESKILPPGPLDILDLGAGCGWMSYRLKLRGHSPVAVDLLTDDRDGLRAARHYPHFPKVEAEFDRLPFPPHSFDVVIYNASLHYSSDYFATLSEAKRCLRPSGQIIIVDSPIYRHREHGERMRRERREQFLQQYGTESDHVGSIEYLDDNTLGDLSRKLGIEWDVSMVWYGWAWHLRPLKAWWSGARPPSRFRILVGEIQ